MNDGALFKGITPRKPRIQAHGREKYAVLKAIAESCSRHNVPPLDERLKSIVATQVGNLLKSGYDLESEIRPVAISLALEYDRFHGHEAMARLQGVVELTDEDRAVEAHMEREQRENDEGIDPRVAAIIAPAAHAIAERKHRHPNNHNFDSDGQGSCRLCGGPPGVHVRLAHIPELEKEVMDHFARDRESRRKMRAIGEPAT